MAESVLLVDDELHILKAAEFKLKRHGYRVRCASDGEEAWEMIQEEAPDVVVTDLQMPRMSGLDLIKNIRACPQTRNLPVIMLTAKGFEAVHRAEFEAQAVVEVIGKPFSPRVLCQRVAHALEVAACGSPADA